MAPHAVADQGLFGPGSVAWRVHADPSALVGGVRALLVQATHPLAMAGVAQHSDYRADPWGRLQRTTDYLMVVTYGTVAEAEAAGRAVRAVHATVSGVDRWTGLPYRADDPDLLAWVHNVMVESILLAYRRYAGGMSDAAADCYVAEMTRIAPLVGLDACGLPLRAAALEDWLAGVEGLVATPEAVEGLQLLRSPPIAVELRPLWWLVRSAAMALLPARIRCAYGLQPVDPAEPAVRLVTSAAVRAARLLLPRPPRRRQAERRLRGVAPIASRESRTRRVDGGTS